jgi:hypothetical protein
MKLTTILISLSILLWGQELKNFNFTKINIRQGATAAGVILGGMSTLEIAKDKRQSQEEKNIKTKIDRELQKYENQLIQIISKVDKEFE